MPIDEIAGEVIGDAVGFVVRQAGGLVVDLTVGHVFSGHTARFFHGVGRRAIALATLGGKRIPSSLRRVPAGTKPKPRASDWWALWTGVTVWIALFVGLGFGLSHLI